MNAMQRFRTYSVSLLVLLSALPVGTAHAQISINSVDFLKAYATSNYWGSYSTPSGVRHALHVGTASATAQEWDLRALPWNSTALFVSEVLSKTPEIARFPSCNVAIGMYPRPSGSPGYQFYELTTSEWILLGLNANGSVTISKPPLRMFKFPCTLGTSWTAATEPYSPVPSITVQTSYTWTADAFGTLRLPPPAPAEPVLRIRTVITTTTTTPAGSSALRSINYHFVSKGLRSASMAIDTADDGRPDVMGTATYTVQEIWDDVEAPLRDHGGFALGAAYPQPAASVANIPLSLASPQHARIEITDVLGRRVALLHDGLLAAGSHTMRWNAVTAESGVYLCSVRIGGAARTLRLLHQR